MEQIVQAFDWKRVLIGDEPPLFLLEIVFRTTFIYLYAMLLLRWLGSRTIGQLSTIEFLLVIALGSAVGDAMFYPDVPLLHALLVITVVVVANKGLDILIARNAAAEQAIDGVPEEAVRDGVICRAFVESTTLSENELFQQLREHGIEQLGEVAHAYVETDGVLTVFRSKKARPGLPIVPPWEIEPPIEVEPSESDDGGVPLACKQCGAVADTGTVTCPHCHNVVWAQSAEVASARIGFLAGFALAQRFGCQMDIRYASLEAFPCVNPKRSIPT